MVRNSQKKKPPKRVVFCFGRDAGVVRTADVVRRSSQKTAIGFLNCEVSSTVGFFGHRSGRSKNHRRRVSTLSHQKNRLVSTSRFFNEIRLTASEIASQWNTLTRVKYLASPNVKRRILFHLMHEHQISQSVRIISYFSSEKYFILKYAGVQIYNSKI